MIARKHACDLLAREAASARARAAADREMDALCEALDRLAARACDLRPTSAEGALFALVLAAAEAETLDVFAVDPGPVVRRLLRHLWSVRSRIERDAALPETLTAYWMPRPAARLDA